MVCPVNDAKLIVNVLLGDAYLKYLSSIYLFVTNPTQHEGILHIARQKIISNKALLVNADKSGLPQYIQSKPFMPKLWTPRGYSVLKLPLKQPVADESAHKDCSVDVKKESPSGADTNITQLQSFDTNGDVEMADMNEPVDPGKPEAQTKAVVSTPKLKKALYDEDHQWLGDKVGVYLYPMNHCTYSL